MSREDIRSVTRTPQAEVGAASAGQDLDPRVATIWFFYNWDTRRKQLFYNDDPQLPKVELNGEWDRLYMIQAHLPVPSLADQRQVVELTSEMPKDRSNLPLPAGRPIAYTIGRRLMQFSAEVVPISPETPLRMLWETPSIQTREASYFPAKTSFLLETHGRKVRITIEELPASEGETTE